jgi:PIN domain nuclease of toxin-antitoxin system
VRLLLDTHVLLWWLTSERLSARAKAAISSADSNIWVSTATVWELSIKSALGKLTFPDDLGDQLSRNQFDVLPIGLDHALTVRSLPALHADPFDRMLIAQAQCDELTLVTRDKNIKRYPVAVLPA